MLGAVLALGGAWSCGASARRTPAENVLLITVDTLRADALGAYGNAAAATPWIDRLARDGARFDDAHAHNVVTLPSHATILSGRSPLDHGVRDNAGFRFPSTTETLATLLGARGWRTAAFVSAFPLAARFGLARGFGVYDDRFVGAGARPVFFEQERRGADTVALARRWLDAPHGGRWFCWVHVYEPHAPYVPPEPFASRFAADPYHGEVAAADAALGPLLEPILAAADGRTLVVLTADHGESLGEHGEATHGIFAYEATLRVPLIVYQPRRVRPGVVSAPARHIDVLPTILDALGLPVPAGVTGRSLLPVAAGADVSGVPTYFEALSGSLDRGWAPLRGVIRDGIKYVDLPVAELYDLRADPREARNLAASRPEMLAGPQQLLATLRASDHSVARRVESAETRERLASLGYVSGAARGERRYGEGDDPKRLIGLDAMLHDVLMLYAAGDRERALARCRELVRARPTMVVSLLHLAALERESGHLPAAVQALQKAAALEPSDTTVLSLLGAYLTQAGRPREAADLLEAEARRAEPDVEVLIARGLALARLGRGPDALATLARARAIEPTNAMILVDLGTVHLMGGERALARTSFEEALAQNPDVARAHSSLGMMAAEDRRVDESIEHWTRALALDPRECDALLATGLLLARQRPADARPYLELFVARAPVARAPEVQRARAWLAANPAPPGAPTPGRR